MKCTITFKNFDHTEALDEKIREKSEKLKKYFDGETSINWTCWVEKNNQVAEAQIKNKTANFVAKAESDSLYKTMDMVIDKLSNQISHRH